MNTKQTNKKLIYGHGTNDLDGLVKVNGKYFKFYTVWGSMLCRCYSGKYQARMPTYRNCSVCPEWLSLSTFRIWFDTNYRDNMELDKDILIQGNKIYSPDTCRFVPHYINSLLTDAGAIRGDLPLGVMAVKSKTKNGQISITYRARCSDGKGGHPNKTFRTIPEAAAWYIIEKKKVVGEQAIRAFLAGDITEDVYQALITREW